MAPNEEPPGVIDEAAARRLVLLQAVESGPAGPHWAPEDARWASRAATEAAGADAGHRAQWLDRRARLAMQRLLPRDEAFEQALTRPLWRPAWVWTALALGLGAGLLSDALLAGTYFNLLSLPFFGLLLWHLVLYGLLLGHAMRQRDTPMGWWRRGIVNRLWAGWRRRAGVPILADFAHRWTAASAPLTTARVAGLLHLGGAALAAGLVAGMYLRALVFDYRAGWSTTLLATERVADLFALVFAPALGLLGMALPDGAGIAALRITPGAAAQASAAPWLHLMAMTLALFVLLPRLCLAGVAFYRARGLARGFPLDLTGPYFDRLQPTSARAATGLWLQPHGQAPDEATVQLLRAWVAHSVGGGAPLSVAEPVAYGDEEAAGMRPVPPGRALLLFDLASTPEPEVHGQLLRAMPGHPILVLDETGFVQRFGAGDRLRERRASWTAFADSHQTPLVTVNLKAVDDRSVDALRTALRGP